jgi:chromosome segregation ATPase
MAKGYRYLIAFLATVALFSTIKYIQLAEEKRKLLTDVEQIWNRVSSLEDQRDSLTQDLKEKGLVEPYLGLAEKEISQINTKLIEAKNTIIELQLSMAELEGEKQRLNIEANRLSMDAKRLSNEKAWLESRFHSVKELKKAIREIKTEIHLVKKDMSKRIDTLVTLGGNRGYMLKDGESTYRRKVKIRVIPATE